LHYIRLLYIAGTETVGAMILWSVVIMLNYPETQEKLHQEISQVLGTRFYFINTASLENYFDAVSLIMKAILLLC